ncbi:UDP-N-acetylmuramoyl-tripeptide--D-alanyl-D-alanine ligase [Sulfuricystis thermophila]|uniref:UDP-N-acetylmuramoyl-tripeptide--D-alanyl-D- alanine ligase n=1 Tax=Sulfuricystis thermophila TaxID=2496847 RepID=UPI0010366501|nr:UDP-N-acetylmuramoyl-tripeptide--D-alanyl-D-alanine ligase [Sulfuricystis thermophila]
MLTLSATALILNGIQTGRDVEFTSVGTDSRAITPGMLFVALTGERFDGHDYVEQALAAGASSALVRSDWAAAHPHLPLVGVNDTRRALGQLAAHWRSRFHIPLIGITGSNGKTTVKEMCAAILRADFGQHAVLATSGNLNNDIGMPLTLLKLHAPHRAAVIEMGMNHPGEIAYLTQIAKPTVAVVTNAQRAHLGGLGSVAEIARAKGEIFAGLSDDGVAIINADDPQAEYWRGLNAGRRIVTFGFSPEATVHGRWRPFGRGGELDLVTPRGDAHIMLPLAGEHNGRNALAAAAACFALGVPLAPIVRGLSGCTGTAGRLQHKRGLRGACVIDDSYNANPDSMRAAIDVLASLPGKRIFVMGDMGEVGEMAGQLHSEVGGYAKSQGIDLLFALGEKSAAAVHDFGSGGRHFTGVDALVRALKPLLDPDTTVLVKGSRFMKMERVVERIVEGAAPESPRTAEEDGDAP